MVTSWSAASHEAVERFVHHKHEHPVHSYTTNAANSWMAVDLGVGRRLAVSHYTLRSDACSGDHKLRHWRLEGSADGEVWTALRTHTKDTKLSDAAMSTASWPVERDGDPTYYRWFRIIQTDLNSSNVNRLMCAGIELYGILEELP